MVQHFTKLLECKEELFWKINILSMRHKEIRCFKDFKLDVFKKKLPKKQLKVYLFQLRWNSLLRIWSTGLMIVGRQLSTTIFSSNLIIFSGDRVYYNCYYSVWSNLNQKARIPKTTSHMPRASTGKHPAPSSSRELSGLQIREITQTSIYT